MVHLLGQDLHNCLLLVLRRLDEKLIVYCRISLERRFSFLSLSSTRIMAILMISAAVPWIGEFIATRSPKDRCIKFEDFNSGTGRRRPNMVVTYPCSFA